MFNQDNILCRRKNLLLFCCCCCFIVLCYVFSFLSSLVSFVSYQFYTCYIYLHIIYILFMHNLFGQFSSLRNTSEHIMLWVSFFRLLVWSHSFCKCPYSFCIVVFQYFHSYIVSYFMLFRAFNNVSCQVC